MKRRTRIDGRNKRIRTVGLTGATLTVAIGGMGCQPCDDQFCKGLKVYGTSVIRDLNLCCSKSAEEQIPCIEGVLEWHRRAHQINLQIFHACHDGNQELLKELWDDLVDIVPAALIDSLCGEVRDLEFWEKHCESLYENSMSLFAPGDTVDFDVALFNTSSTRVSSLVGGTSGERSNFAGSGFSGGVGPADTRTAGEEVYAVTPGSVIGVDTWLGSANFMVTGVVGIGPLLENQHGDYQASVTQFSMDLVDAERGLFGSITLAGDAVPSVVLVDERGDGRIGVPVTVDVRLIDDPNGPSFGDLFSRTWIEMPVNGITRRRASIGGDEVIAGLDLMPVDPEHRVMLETAFSEDGEGQLANAMGDGNDDGGDLSLCALQQLPDGSKWSQWAINEWNMLKKAFPDCFENDSSD